ncbi:ATP-binding protein [Bacillus sp. SCS-151]|uniref:ATP-binding protein n=1 Tax=Nanhaiella sioensis TaxID=3115293 RepID=UPI00397AE5BC
MKKKHGLYKHISFYILLVIIPSILIITVVINYVVDDLKKDLYDETKEIVKFHENHIDSFIGEAKVSLETLALVYNILDESESNLTQILQNTQQKDPRFDGLYFVNKSGVITVGSTAMLENVPIYDREYFLEAQKTKKTTISKSLFSRVSGDEVIVVITPITQNNDEIKGYLLASLRLNYMENVMNQLTPNMIIKVSDSNQPFLFGTKQAKNINEPFPIKEQFNEVPWVIEAQPLALEKKELIQTSLLIIGLTFFFTNILFLFGEYVLLKRKAKVERLQNDAQKLELVGALAASTAHEIRNPLTGIKGLIQLLSEKYKNQEDQYYFSVIQTEINRINEISSEFLVLGKPTIQKNEKYCLVDILDELDPILRSEANLYNVELDVITPTHKVYVRLSKDHIKQVILNLTKNALESIKNDGQIKIQLCTRDKFCRLEITDNGKGMTEEVLSKVFTPFFTMKDKGTGLGLVVCKRIVNMYNGHIKIHSIENKGTTVEILFPLCTSKK